MAETYEGELSKGHKALQAGETLVALIHFETAFKLQPEPAIMARLGYCLARERQQLQKGAALCREALQADSTNPDHYLQLGRILLLAGKKNQAIATFRKGLKHRRYQPLIDELHQLGLRRKPVFPSLPREHFLNRHTGRLMARLGAR